jgi:magnesium-transporting ATPase (P-type)
MCCMLCLPPAGCPQVSEGSGRVLVVAVGDKSEWGKTISLVTSSGDEHTPLQVRAQAVPAVLLMLLPVLVCRG